MAKDISCDLDLCVYNSEGSCELDSITISLEGCCINCFYVSLPNEVLEQYRRSTKEKLEQMKNLFSKEKTIKISFPNE